MHALLFRPRRDHGANAVLRHDIAFRILHYVGSRNESLSGLNHTACILPVYASRQESPHCHATLGSGCRHTCRAGVATRRVPMKVSEIYAISSPFPRLCPAHARPDPDVFADTGNKLLVPPTDDYS